MGFRGPETPCSGLRARPVAPPHPPRADGARAPTPTMGHGAARAGSGAVNPGPVLVLPQNNRRRPRSEASASGPVEHPPLRWSLGTGREKLGRGPFEPGGLRGSLAKRSPCFLPSLGREKREGRVSPARGVALGGDARGHAPDGSAAARPGHPGSFRRCPGTGRCGGCCATAPIPTGVRRVPAGAAKPAREAQPRALPVPCPILCFFPVGSHPCPCAPCPFESAGRMSACFCCAFIAGC